MADPKTADAPKTSEAGANTELSPADKLKAQRAADLKAASDAAEARALAENEAAPADVDGGDVFSAVSDDAAARESREAKMVRAEEAAKKLRQIALSYPATTPNEHTVFGFGGHRFTLGELRDLFALPKP